MDKVKIGFPIEYEDENNIVRNGLFLREPEIKELEKRLKEINKITDLENKLRTIKKELQLITSDRNDLKLKAKKFNLEIEKIKRDGCKEYKKELKREISNLKGHISKETILNIISNTKLNNKTKERTNDS